MKGFHVKLDRRRTIASALAGAPISMISAARGAQAQTDFLTDGIVLHDIDTELLPFGATKNYAVRTGEGFDDEGVRLNLRAGEWQDNPVTQSQYGMMLLAGYRANGWDENLEVAIANGRRIHKNSESIEGRTYFPYGFQMPLFSRDDMVLDPPWYSGMAQGQVLQFYSQLFAITEDTFWRDAAKGVFESFRDVMNRDLPWCPTVDENSNLWFEEYPYDPEQHVLNGHVFALAGVYEYWQATGDKWAETLTKGSIRTILDRKDDYRVVGQQSHYALAQNVQHDGYHAVHINQLLFLYAVTHDARFAQTAHDFADDWDITNVSGDLNLESGDYQATAPANSGSLFEIGDEKIVTMEESVTLRVKSRRQDHHGSRVFYEATDKDGEILWLEETEGCTMRGLYEGTVLLAGTSRGTLLTISPAQGFNLEIGTYKAYPLDSDYTLDPETFEVTESASVEVMARALITAESYVLTAIDGVGDYWIEWGEHFVGR